MLITKPDVTNAVPHEVFVDGISLSWKQARVRKYDRYARHGWVKTDDGDIVYVSWKTLVGAGMPGLEFDQQVDICFKKQIVLEAAAIRSGTL